MSRGHVAFYEYRRTYEQETVYPSLFYRIGSSNYDELLPAVTSNEQVLMGRAKMTTKEAARLKVKTKRTKKKEFSAWNATPFVEKPDNPTLDGDINKIIVGVC